MKSFRIAGNSIPFEIKTPKLTPTMLMGKLECPVQRAHQQ